ncbi:fibronectin type III domain-containing protein [Chryseolinea lacunae]|uniref:Fibronectin type III domain-containing protein n=1 Tax=Chryseolinea lacunae TaxID=2801331 RepID=A0ABS1KTE6_9BACT|nr:fibronectin type III domain-containing protein [Chryseolinea lacunae]MBL0742735.1 fibronectin type III domain-containing protein [Chryseolinea lacunae]
MTIVRVLSSFTRLTDTELVAFTQNVLSGMTGNADFATPKPALADIEAALQVYITALGEALGGTKGKTSGKAEKRQALEMLLRQLATFVEMNCNNNATVALNSGFNIRKPSTPVGILGKPVIAKFEAGPNKGSIRLSVNKITGADSYVFQYVEAPVTAGSVWQTQAATARTIIISNLTVAKEYAFRVAAVGSNPTLVFSDEVTRVVA